jgi:hypothetical protein
MSGFTKLFSSIVHSTIWREPNHVRVVWVTMLALCDRDGIVGASVPGLADVARVSLADCQEALERLLAPDEFSRTPEFEGRRIEATKGGWRVLNYQAHRDRMSLDDQRERNRERQARFKARRKSEQASVTQSNAGNARSRSVAASNPIAEAEAEAEAESRREQDLPPRASRSATEDGFAAFWSLYPRKLAKAQALKAWNTLKPNTALQQVIAAEIRRQAATEQWQRDRGRFIPHAATWLRGRRWEDQAQELPTVNALQRSPALEALLDRADIKQYDQHQWFSTAELDGRTLRVAGATQADWIRRNYAERLTHALGFPLAIVSTEERQAS